MHDRTTVSLATPDERWSRFVANNTKAKRELESMIYPMVLEVVHPGNLGALPPAPDVLVYKAEQVGLIGKKDLAVLFNIYTKR
jgi:hypothetical protein